MEKSERFSEYLFAKMGPGDRGPQTTEDRTAPVEPTGAKKWFIDNTMLVVTLIGVITGISVGELVFCLLLQQSFNSSFRQKQYNIQLVYGKTK